MKERPIQEYYDKAQELATSTQCLYYYREYVARGMQYQEAVTREEIAKKAQDWIYWNVRKYIHVDSQGIAHINETEISEDLRKALEE